MRRAGALRGALLGALLLGCGTLAAAEQSRDDAWWTGPMLAPSAGSLPTGHVLIEPYLFDVMSRGRFDAHGAHLATTPEHDLGSLTYLLYGLTDRLTLGLIPRFLYNEPAGAPSSSGIGSGDLTLQAGYGLSRFTEDHRVPTVSVVLGETLPTGRYERLARASDGFGAGAYTTTLSLYSQYYFWMPNGRILRTRLDLSYAWSSAASVHDQSVYGTPFGFRGQAYPGAGITVDAAGEYSMTRNWVLALDVVYQHNDSTRVTGTVPAPPPASFSAFGSDSGSGYSFALAPAIEYNWNARIGALLGVRIIDWGRNAGASVTPAIALNMVF